MEKIWSAETDELKIKIYSIRFNCQIYILDIEQNKVPFLSHKDKPDLNIIRLVFDSEKEAKNAFFPLLKSMNMRSFKIKY